MPNSGTALAVQEVARTLKKINITSTAGSLALTGKSCGPTSFHWMWDTYSNSYGLVKALSKKKLDTWFFITADYAFGHALEADFRKAIEQMGGKTLGSGKPPRPEAWWWRAAATTSSTRSSPPTSSACRRRGSASWRRRRS
jgi:branched-chain amino acid transport system substrate-binding protein